jgi:hypothetical protein
MEGRRPAPEQIEFLTGLTGLTGLPHFPLSRKEWHLEAGPYKLTHFQEAFRSTARVSQSSRKESELLPELRLDAELASLRMEVTTSLTIPSIRA